jgi:MFS family permease
MADAFAGGQEEPGESRRVAPILAEQIPERRLLLGLLVASSALLVLLAAARSFWPFGVLRGAQCLAIAPFVPLMVAQVARRGDAHAIGIINAARVGSGFVGPLVATTVLATGRRGSSTSVPAWRASPPLSCCGEHDPALAIRDGLSGRLGSAGQGGLPVEPGTRRLELRR